MRNKNTDYVMKIDNPVTAMVYLESFFKEYDWETYKLTEAISIPEIDELVKKFRIQFCDNSTSWMLDFESRITPFFKKLEALAALENDIFTLYNGELTSEIKSKFALYSGLTDKLKKCADDVFAALKTDIENAEQLGEREEIVTDMKIRFNDAAAIFNEGVRNFDSIGDLPAIQLHRERLDREANKALHDKGIDARATYEKAVALYNSQENKENALHLFEAIREYKDSAEYVAKINEFFNFDSKLIKIVGKHFVLKKVAAPTFTVYTPKKKKKAKKNAIDVPAIPTKGIGPSVSLYEVVDGKVYEPALVSGISYILSYYGNKIFYVKKNRILCCFDAYTRIETELDRANTGDYSSESIYWNKNKTAFYIKKKLPAFRAERSGCLRAIFSIFKKKPHYVTDTKNNYSLLKVDGIDNSVSVEIDRLIDITECYDDRLFYIAFPTLGTRGARGLSPLPSFMVCDLKDGSKAKVLGDDCHIHNVIGNTVIYSTWDPNEYNKMLFSYDLTTDTTTLIEANVFEYFASLGERVYYKIGNKKHAPLFSNNLDGTDRFEITDNVREVYASFDKWIYVLTDKDGAISLVKISTDGKTSLTVADDVAHISHITASYTYYIDSKGALHVVDNDGISDITIADDVDADNVIPDKKYIYFLRREQVSKDTSAASLYRVDAEGRNLKKLVFNVSAIKNYDDNSIYVHRSILSRYVATETENGAVKSEKQVKYRVSRFSILDKTTESETEIAVLGLPSEKTNIEKRGCFKKNIKRSVYYRELSYKTPYKKPGIAKVGEVFTEQTEIEKI